MRFDEVYKPGYRIARKSSTVWYDCKDTLGELMVAFMDDEYGALYTSRISVDEALADDWYIVGESGTETEHNPDDCPICAEENA